MQSQDGSDAGASKSVQERVRSALYVILNPIIGVGLFWLALLETLLAPFCGAKFAFSAIATSVCALALLVALAGLGVDYLGACAARIHDQIISLHDDELRKLANSQRRAVPEPRAKFPIQ